jgi:uncharacterized RDD family membrane protein YckC
MDEQNIYQSPNTSLVTEEVIDNIENLMAGRSIRFFTYLLDVVFIYILAFIIGITMYLVMGDSWMENVFNKIPDLLFGYILLVIYYWPQEALFGRTLAKLILGTKVVDENGKKIGPATALGRTFARLIPFEPFSFFGGKARGWHDSLSSTYVIKSR